MRNKIIFAGVAVAVFLAALAGGFFGPSYLRERQERQDAISFVAPDMPESAVTDFSRQFSKLLEATQGMRLPEQPFVDIKGEIHRFSDFAGKPTLVNFWATWCAPCVVELPALEKLAKYYDGRMNVVGVAIEPGKTPADIASFLEKRLLGSFAGYLDTEGALMNELTIQGLPTSFLIESDGLIRYRFEGDADWTSEEARAFFDAFLLQKR